MVFAFIPGLKRLGFPAHYTKTYAALQNTTSVMWAESAEFIVDEYYREIE